MATGAAQDERIKSTAQKIQERIGVPKSVAEIGGAVAEIGTQFAKETVDMGKQITPGNILLGQIQDSFENKRQSEKNQPIDIEDSEPSINKPSALKTSSERLEDARKASGDENFITTNIGR